MGHIWATHVQEIGLWTFEPAFSPRFLPTLSPRSIFSTGQQFLPILSPRSFFFHWSAVSHLKSRDFRFHEPTIPFSHWSAVSHPTSGHDVTRPIRSLHLSQTGPLYYSLALQASKFCCNFWISFWILVGARCCSG